MEQGFDGIELVVSPGCQLLEGASDRVLPGSVGARIFWEDICLIASEVGVSAGGKDVRDVLGLPEGKQGIRV